MTLGDSEIRGQTCGQGYSLLEPGLDDSLEPVELLISYWATDWPALGPLEMHVVSLPVCMPMAQLFWTGGSVSW